MYVELLDENKYGNNNFVSPVESCQFYKEAGEKSGKKVAFTNNSRRKRVSGVYTV
jgi:hypothetical protein